MTSTSSVVLAIAGSAAALLILGGALPVQTPALPTPRLVLRDEPFPKRVTACPGHGELAIPQIPLVGSITNIPEYHDCQRFIRRNAYDSLYSVFIVEDADRLLDRLRELECAPASPAGNAGGALRRLGTGTGAPVTDDLQGPSLVVDEPPVVPQGSCRAQANAQYNAVAITAAVVVSWGGRYRPLGIEANFNCLYIYDSARLKAKMRPVGMESSRCVELVDPAILQGTPLNVRRITRSGLGPSDYPRVARWDRDPRTGNMFIGIICGAGWCEIGQRSATTSPQYVFTEEAPTLRRVKEVKGWYDEQRLAEVGENGKVRPSSVTGTLIPHPQLDSYTLEAFTPGAWLPTFSAAISGRHKKYLADFNFEPSKVGGRLNEGFLCRGTLEECVPRAHRTSLVGCNPSTDGSLWFMRVVSVSGREFYRCAGRYAHPEALRPIPGTVRWAWFDNDEGTWHRCPFGCCYPT